MEDNSVRRASCDSLERFARERLCRRDSTVSAQDEVSAAESTAGAPADVMSDGGGIRDTLR